MLVGVEKAFRIVIVVAGTTLVYIAWTNPPMFSSAVGVAVFIAMVVIAVLAARAIQRMFSDLKSELDGRDSL